MRLLAALVALLLNAGPATADHMSEDFVNINAYCKTAHSVQVMVTGGEAAAGECFASTVPLIGFVREQVETVTLDGGLRVGIYRVLLPNPNSKPDVHYTAVIEPAED